MHASGSALSPASAQRRKPCERFTVIMAQHTENPLLEVSNLKVAYSTVSRGQVEAIRDASFVIRRGETVGLLGESGSGKSTIALTLLGLLSREAASQDGAIRFNGRELQALNEREWERIRGAEIALISQDPALALCPVKRVGEQIADVLQAHRPWPRNRCREEAKSLLESMHLQDTGRVFSSYPFQLSGGQLQRIVIAQALACKPSLVIADEPTSALDSILRLEILRLFEELKHERGMAVLFISHEPEILARLADRILVMQEGKIIEEGAFAQLRDNPANQFTRELLAAMRCPATFNSQIEREAKSPGKAPEWTSEENCGR